jgi:hypothetical protein
MCKLFVCLGAGILATIVNSISCPAEASVSQKSQIVNDRSSSILLAQADQSALIKQNKDLLLTNRTLARKIAAKLGITSSGEVPTSGTPLEQNQVLMLQNQETFKEIATKVDAPVPTLSEPTGADRAEKNHNILLQNKSIVVGILKKLSIPPAPPAELKGTFVEKNHTLLVGNGKALTKIAAKLGVK